MLYSEGESSCSDSHGSNVGECCSGTVILIIELIFARDNFSTFFLVGLRLICCLVGLSLICSLVGFRFFCTLDKEYLLFYSLELISISILIFDIHYSSCGSWSLSSDKRCFGSDHIIDSFQNNIFTYCFYEG